MDSFREKDSALVVGHYVSVRSVVIFLVHLALVQICICVGLMCLFLCVYASVSVFVSTVNNRSRCLPISDTPLLHVRQPTHSF